MSEITAQSTVQVIFNSEDGINHYSTESGINVTFMDSSGNETDEYFNTKDTVLIVVLALLITCGIFGNCLSFLVMVKNGLTKSSVSFLLAVLAVSDSTYLIVGSLWQFIYPVSKKTIEYDVYTNCSMGWVVYYFTLQFSAWLVVIITTERYICVCFPFKTASLITMKHVVTTVCTTATLLFALNTPLFMYIRVISDGQYRWCGAVGDDWMHYSHVVYPWIDTVIYGYIPALAIVFMNINIIVKLVRRTSTKQMRSTNQASNEQASRRITVMLLSVSFMFLCTVIPGQFYFVFEQVSENETGAVSSIVGEILLTVNHSMNFYLYALTGPQFRKDVMSLLCCRKRK